MIANIGQGKLSKEDLTHLRETVNAEPNPVTYISIDPGKSNGICGYDTKCYLQFMLTLSHEEVDIFLEQFECIKKLILENYKVYPGKEKDHVYNDLLTPQVIGAVKSWGRRKDVEVILQMASIKPTAYKWLGKKPLPHSNPQNHALDAHAHFTYWAVRRGLINPNNLVGR